MSYVLLVKVFIMEGSLKYKTPKAMANARRVRRIRHLRDRLHPLEKYTSLFSCDTAGGRHIQVYLHALILMLPLS